MTDFLYGGCIGSGGIVGDIKLDDQGVLDLVGVLLRSYEFGYQNGHVLNLSCRSHISVCACRYAISCSTTPWERIVGK